MTTDFQPGDRVVCAEVGPVGGVAARRPLYDRGTRVYVHWDVEDEDRETPVLSARLRRLNGA